MPPPAARASWPRTTRCWRWTSPPTRWASASAGATRSATSASGARSSSACSALPEQAPTPSLDAFLALVDPDDRRRVADELLARPPAGSVQVFEYRITPPGAARRTLMSRAVVRPDASGRPWRYYFVVVDITESRVRDRQLVELAQRLQLATEASGIGTWDRDPRRPACPLGRHHHGPVRPAHRRAHAHAGRIHGHDPPGRPRPCGGRGGGPEGPGRVRVPRLPARRQRALAGHARPCHARRCRARGAPHRHLPGRDRPARGPGRAAGQGTGRTCQCRQDRVPVAHEPRVAHTAQRRARFRAGDDAGHGRAAVRFAAHARRPHPDRRAGTCWR